MACSNCGDNDHNIQTCPKARRCSVCGKTGHNSATCAYSLVTEDELEELELELAEDELEELELELAEEEEEETIIFELITGHLVNVDKNLMKRSKELIKDSRKFTIGITGNPYTRFAQRYKNEYDKMYVIYRTIKHSYTRKAEIYLLDMHFDNKKCDNKNRGGGGPKGSESPYFVYIAIKY
ncbi:MAG: hypothetical protein JZU64_07210 [Rhodoferax sp.]|nr:hypothetical protein [Rhodoferax sp.]